MEYRKPRQQTELFNARSPIRIGILVNATFKPWFARLHLESWRRHCVGVPLLVCGKKQSPGINLGRLCQDYAVEYSEQGDSASEFVENLASIVAGVQWAETIGVNVLVHFAADWIPVIEWQRNFVKLLTRTQYASYSVGDPFWGFAFHWEAFALHIPSWLSYGGMTTLREYGGLTMNSLLGWLLYTSALKVYHHRSPKAKKFEQKVTCLKETEGFGSWQLHGLKDRDHRGEALSPVWAEPHEYDLCS